MIAPEEIAESFKLVVEKSHSIAIEMYVTVDGVMAAPGAADASASLGKGTLSVREVHGSMAN